MITTFSNQKSNLVSTKTLIEMLSFLKIEKDGTEIKNTLLHPNIQQCIRIADNTYKYEEKEKKVEIKTEFEIRIKNKEGKKIFSCELKDIYKIVDKQRNEGKLTILIEKDKSKYFIFLFKSTKEAIEHFLDKINVAKNNINKNTNAININTNSIKSILMFIIKENLMNYIKSKRMI